MNTFSATTAALALAAILPAVQAGKAIINNHCGFPVAVWPVDISRNPASPIMVKSGSTYSEDYHYPSSGGVSIKVASSSAGGPVTQLEYTIANTIFYDVSNIDCSGTSCPFQSHGMYLESGSGCPTVSCPGGELTCSGAYNLPDDVRTLACKDMSADTTLHLCRTSSSSRRWSPEHYAGNETYGAIVPPPSSTLATVTVPAAAIATGKPTKSWNHAHPSKRAVQHPHARRHE